MAIDRITTNEYDAAKHGLGFPLNFRRGEAFPLDNSAVWATLAAAKSYAENDPTAYVGQPIAVISNDDNFGLYIISNIAGNLERVGKEILIDNITIKRNANHQLEVQFDSNTLDINDNGITLKGFNDASARSHLIKNNEGALEWEEMGTVYTPKGSIADLTELKSKETTAKVGDVYNVATGGVLYSIATTGEQLNPIHVNNGENVVFKEVETSIGFSYIPPWDPLGGFVDLSNYVTSTQLTNVNNLVNYYDKNKIISQLVQLVELNPNEYDYGEEDIALTDTLNAFKAKWDLLNKHTTDIADNATALGERVLTTTFNEAINIINQSLNGKALKTDLDAAKERISTLEDNEIDGLKLGDNTTNPTIVTPKNEGDNRYMGIPAATASVLGLIKPNNNEFIVTEDGAMSINKIGLSKITQDINLIIYGGNATAAGNIPSTT